jgi:DNA-binding CsgD family transcriptional regulator
VEAASAEMERAVPGLVRDRPAAAVHAMTMLARPLGTAHPASWHRAWLERAGCLVEALPKPSPAERLSYLMDRAATLLVLGDPAGWAAAQELPVGGKSPDQVLHRARGFANLGEAAVLWGRYGEARRWLNAAAALADEHEHLRLRDLVRAALAHLDWLTGHWPAEIERWPPDLDAEEPALQADELLLSGLLDAARGDHRRAQERVRAAVRVGRPRGPADGFRDPSTALARLAGAAGRPTEVLAATDAAWRLVEDKQLWLWAAEIAPLRVRALLDDGRAAEAARAAEAFAAATRRLDAPIVTAAGQLTAAVLTRSRGELSTAAELFEKAGAAWSALPRPYDALLAREEAAGCHMAAGDRGRAVDVLRDVFAGFTSLGAAGDADRVRGTLTRWGVRGGGRGRPSYGDQLSPRELEVVRLLVQGRTSAQIARALVLSPRTVEKHVQSAMRKRNAPSRTALALAVVESGDAPTPASAPPVTHERTGARPTQ